nr:mannose-1-phosphate guanylyltransferase/mannose-6-phosphate isomerase [Sphingomonas sp.]
MIRPVILCGGSGTRLWPVSRQLFPKQFLSLIGTGSLLQQTAMRLPDDGFSPAIVVSGEEQRLPIKSQLEATGAVVEAILLEPSGRNTSSAATLAAAWLRSTGRDEILLLMPSDHVIADAGAFLNAVQCGLPHANEGAIVTFGAQPTGPNTQYGYIEADTGGSHSDTVFPIAKFHEKPDAAKAAEYVRSGRFFWNSGIFLLKASTLLDEMRHFLPRSLDAIAGSVEGATVDGLFVRPAADAFERAENISIDHGIMEKTARGMVVPVQMEWSDVGSWDAVWKLGSRDAAGNVTRGDTVVLDTTDSLLWSEGPLVTTIGLDKIVVIAVGDAILVAPMDRMTDLKTLVDKVKAEHAERTISPPKAADEKEQ